ncbi:hypothetical protein EPUL_001339 [Erysiphe pulchra]|uniref:Retrotransposon gag domain-containing protein n=1 Tax=Erysiphe pulchra TaxID=225359 RepID=A0A2S4PY98_9PEZI|nr:hypothetical protein EPUL_001339 [Erysiphe pulchra]
MASVLISAQDLISRIDGASPENRGIILTDLYNSCKKIQECADKLQLESEERRQEISNSKAVLIELRNELKNLQKSASDALQALAVFKYRLSEAKKLISELQSENRSLYSAFQRQIKIALAQNSDRYVTLQSQISLIYKNLGTGPKSFLDRYLLDDGNFAFKSLTEVWNFLDVSFKNPNEKEDARDALSRLRQGKRSFGSYLAEFQRLQNLSQITDDKTLIAYMRDGVSPNLTLCIGQQQLFNKTYSFDDFVQLCKECVIRLDWMRLPIRAAVNPIRNDLTPRGINLTQPVAAEYIGSPNASSESGTNLIPLGDPMVLDRLDLSHIGPDGHIIAEERLRQQRLSKRPEIQMTRVQHTLRQLSRAEVAKPLQAPVYNKIFETKVDRVQFFQNWISTTAPTDICAYSDGLREGSGRSSWRENVFILLDNQAAVMAVQKELRLVPGHSKIRGNEEADAEARAALRDLPERNTQPGCITLAYLRRLMQQRR